MDIHSVYSPYYQSGDDSLAVSRKSYRIASLRTAAEYEYAQAIRDAFEMIADTHTDPMWLVLHHANHYSHAAFKVMKEMSCPRGH